MVLGIIAEYNPFHNGHLYHLLKSKELTKDDYVIGIISGNFTQRGEPSIVNKWVKCEMALSNGIDLVIELPTIYATSSAENFADGAIKILNSLNIVDNISFGAECTELNKLNLIANTLYNEPKEYQKILSCELSIGTSFPKSREKAIIQYLKDASLGEILQKPNNILAIEYLKSLKKHRSNIKPILIPRKISGHLNLEYTGEITSSTAIRNMFKIGKTVNLKNALTPSSYIILKDEISNGHFINDFSPFENICFYNLRNMNTEKIGQLLDVNEGLENLIKKASILCNNQHDFINIVISKRYTETRIKRILLYSLLNITKKDFALSKKTLPYVRVLGFNSKGKQLLSKISKNAPNLKIITSVKKFLETNSNRNLNLMLDKDIFATNCYTLGYLKDSYSNLDFTKKIIEKK